MTMLYRCDPISRIHMRKLRDIIINNPVCPLYLLIKIWHSIAELIKILQR